MWKKNCEENFLLTKGIFFLIYFLADHLITVEVHFSILRTHELSKFSSCILLCYTDTSSHISFFSFSSLLFSHSNCYCIFPLLFVMVLVSEYLTFIFFPKRVHRFFLFFFVPLFLSGDSFNSRLACYGTHLSSFFDIIYITFSSYYISPYSLFRSTAGNFFFFNIIFRSIPSSAYFLINIETSVPIFQHFLLGFSYILLCFNLFISSVSNVLPFLFLWYHFFVLTQQNKGGSENGSDR